MKNETEVKVLVADLGQFQQRLSTEGFREITPRTHEFNVLYDRDGMLRRRGEILRIRKYGERWTLTHKSKGSAGPHKVRVETETEVGDGDKLASIFAMLGFEPAFTYEKFRSEWSDGEGHVVLDETPIGNVAEIEGSAEWIDRTAARLGIGRGEYITKSYAELFAEWKARTGSRAREMTFAAIARSADKQ